METELNIKEILVKYYVKNTKEGIEIFDKILSNFEQTLKVNKVDKDKINSIMSQSKNKFGNLADKFNDNSFKNVNKIIKELCNNLKKIIDQALKLAKNLK